MNCSRVVNSSSAYVDGELTGAEMLEIRRHLSNCRECSEEYEFVRATKLAVARLRTVAPPEHLVASIVARLDQVSIPPYQRALNVLFKFAAKKLSPVAAALAVSGIALAILSAGGQDPILAVKPDMVASAPLSVRVENASIEPQMPDTPITYSSSKPLVIADHGGAAAFEFADMSIH